jgi:hypothetical protein
MVEQMFQLFTSFYTLPKASWEWVVFAIGLSLVFGAAWIASFWPPLFKKWWLWLVLVAAFILPTLVIAFIQFPVQALLGQALINFLGGFFQPIAVNLITGFVIAIISALIIQGILLVPVLYYKLNKAGEFTPRFGLMVGALAGAVLGMIQAYMLFGKLVEIGIGSVLAANPLTYLAFFERFLGVALFAGTTALVGYGLAKGKGWQAYLIMSAVHFVYTYCSLLLAAKVLNLPATEVILSLLSLAAIGLALWLYWKKTKKD